MQTVFRTKMSCSECQKQLAASIEHIQSGYQTSDCSANQEQYTATCYRTKQNHDINYNREAKTEAIALEAAEATSWQPFTQRSASKLPQALPPRWALAVHLMGSNSGNNCSTKMELEHRATEVSVDELIGLRVGEGGENEGKVNEVHLAEATGNPTTPPSSSTIRKATLRQKPTPVKAPLVSLRNSAWLRNLTRDYDFLSSGYKSLEQRCMKYEQQLATMDDRLSQFESAAGDITNHAHACECAAQELKDRARAMEDVSKKQKRQMKRETCRTGDKPKCLPSAFALYTKHIRSELQGAASMQAREAAVRWKTLSQEEKGVFIDEAAGKGPKKRRQ